MVTAILVPAICIYFYFLTKKEMKLFQERWNQLEHIHEEAVVTGKVVDVREETQHFYYHRYVHCMYITLQSANHTIVVKKVTPIKKDFQAPTIKTGEYVRIFGNWENKEFLVARIESVKQVETPFV